MSDTTDTTETSTENTPENTPENTTEPGTGSEETGKSGNAEAARYRTRLRETEVERDSIAERLTGYQRREAERIAEGTLSRPADLWLDGTEVGELLNDEHQVDPEKVTAAVASVLTDRPQLEAGRVRPRPDRAQGGTVPKQAPGWGDVLRARKA